MPDSNDTVADEKGKEYQRMQAEEHSGLLTTTNLLCAYSLSFVTAIEGTISQPSLWLYVQSLGGSEAFYAVCVMCFPLGRGAFMGIFAMWTQRRTYQEVWLVSLCIGMLSGILYSLAPSLGLWTIPVGRAVLGAMSCQTVTTQGYVATHTSPKERTAAMTINTQAQSALSIAGPAFNVFLLWLPRFSVWIAGQEIVFNNYTWVGWFLFICQGICLCSLVIFYKEPERAEAVAATEIGPCGKCVTLGGFFPWGRLFADKFIYESGAWFCYILNFRNQFTNYAVVWVVPLITDRDYGFNQVDNSYVFVALAIESLAASWLVGELSLGRLKFFGKTLYEFEPWNDRDQFCVFQIVSWAAILVYTLISWCGTTGIALWIFIVLLVIYDFGAPASQVQSIYSKLVGRGNQVLYFAVFQSNILISKVSLTNQNHLEEKKS
jgi:hypothetical protein